MAINVVIAAMAGVYLGLLLCCVAEFARTRDRADYFWTICVGGMFGAHVCLAVVA